MSEEGQNHVAEQHQAADDVGLATASLVFEQASVLAPVESVFHPAPMASDGGIPLLWTSMLHRLAAEIVAIFPRAWFACFLAVAVHTQGGAGIREVGAERVNGNSR